MNYTQMQRFRAMIPLTFPLQVIGMIVHGLEPDDNTATETLCPTADNVRDAFHVAGTTPLPVPNLTQLDKECDDYRVFVVVGRDVDYAKRLEHDYHCSEGEMNLWYGLRLRYLLGNGRID